MVRGDRCCVGTCDNDTRYQERFVVKGYVQKLMFHRLPRYEEKRKTWASLLSKGRSGFTPSDGSRICSNHFKDGQPTTKNPNLTLWLTIQDNQPGISANQAISPILANSPNQARKHAYLGEKTTLSKIPGPGPTSAGSFRIVFSSKNESGIAQLFMRSLNRAT